MVSHLENNLQMVGFPHLVDRRVQRPHCDLTGIMVRDNYIIASNYPPILSYFIFIHSKSPSNHGNYPNLSDFSVTSGAIFHPHHAMVPHLPAACGRRVRPARLATVPAAVQRPVASAGVGATLLAGALGHVLGRFCIPSIS